MINTIQKLEDLKVEINTIINELQSKKDIFSEIIDVISGKRWQIDRYNAAMTWCRINDIDPANATDLFNEVNKGEKKPDKSEDALNNGWRIPTPDEVKTFIRHRKAGKKYASRRVWCQVDNKLQTIGTNTFEVKNPQKEINSAFSTYFCVLVKNTKTGLVYKDLAGLYSNKQLKKAKNNQHVQKKQRAYIKGSGARRSSPKIFNSRFKTGMKYVTFHYAFGNMSSAPKDSRNFAMRAFIAESNLNPVGIKLKDFEVNDTGLVNARYYIDSEIKRLGLDIPLHFKDGDYNFIDVYGPRMWIKVSGFKSKFDYDLNRQIIINKYFDVADKYAIDNSFAKRVIIDNKPDIDIKNLSAKLISNITIYKEN